VQLVAAVESQLGVVAPEGVVVPWRRRRNVVWSLEQMLQQVGAERAPRPWRRANPDLPVCHRSGAFQDSLNHVTLLLPSGAGPS